MNQGASSAELLEPVEDRGGLPVGMQLIGRSFDEATLLRIGAAFQRATDFHERVPKLP
jgi:aspartyl-tRNA(Asn)/glutamyl-tRNA(Gln) amidotransferase subunit A